MQRKMEVTCQPSVTSLSQNSAYDVWIWFLFLFCQKNEWSGFSDKPLSILLWCGTMSVVAIVKALNILLNWTIAYSAPLLKFYSHNATFWRKKIPECPTFVLGLVHSLDERMKRWNGWIDSAIGWPSSWRSFFLF